MRKAIKSTSVELLKAFQERLDEIDDFQDITSNPKDFKISMSFENYQYEPNDLDSPLGLRRIYLDFSEFYFIGCQAGGDWEYPVYFIVYLDNKSKLRVYIPKDGNAFNKNTKEAFGNDEDDDFKYLIKWSKNNNVFMNEALKYDGSDHLEDYFGSLLDLNKIKQDISKHVVIDK